MGAFGLPDLRDPDAIGVSGVHRDQIEPAPRHGLALRDLGEDGHELVLPPALGSQTAVQHEH